jgi:hypothetical protein
LAYIAAADFRERTQKSWCGNLILSEGDGTDALLDSFITQAAASVEVELDDDFDPPSPDNDETVYVDGTIGSRLHIPRRVRSLTTVSSRNLSNGNIVAIPTSRYLLHSSLNAAGTAMIDRRKRDWLDSSSGDTWYSSGGIQLIGKFGWSAVPTDIKRLVALRVYRLIKATTDPLTIVTQKTTVDSIMTFGPSSEETSIVDRYSRRVPAIA